MDLTGQGRFAYDEGGLFCANTVYVMSGQSIKYLCAMLNSSLITWFMRNTALTSGMGVTRWFSTYVEIIPIPKIPAADQSPFTRLVDEILEAKAADPSADTFELETEIDDLVYDLYGLTEEERTAVERSLGLIHATDEEEDAAIARAIEYGLREGRGSMAEVNQVLREWDEART